MEYKTIRQKLNEQGRFNRELSDKDIKDNVSITNTILEDLRKKTQMYSTSRLIKDLRIMRRGYGDE